MNKLRVAVIGCGRISVTYRQALLNCRDDITVCFAVDKEVERAKKFAEEFPGCGWSDKYSDLLALHPDVVHVCTPHFLHKEHVCQALKAGCNVLTEKPIALNISDAEEMMDTACKYGKQLGVIFQNRYIEGIQEAKRLLDAGVLGKITGAWSTLNWHRPPSYYECDWKGSWEKEGGGVVIDQAIHSIDLVRYLMGCDVESIRAQIDRRILTNIEVEDVASAAIRFANGAVYSFFACNYYTSNSPIRIEISCEKGSILLMHDVVTISYDGVEHVLRPIQQQTVGERYWGNYHTVQIRDFYKKLRSGQAVPVQAHDATKTLAVVLGIYQSAREHREVRPEC